ncbi:MAG: cold shock domain-containing protein [Tenuifilaceae bacterium]|jgi:cold shock CspA family protein|nr:cold shock domain-containing protein [Tenuifilaceae bacterium]
MGRSQESFNKRENEKKRQKKKQDKLQKKEERKSSSEKASFDDMIAYVDQFGNITDTPPDPSTKEKIKSEDIEIGVPRQAPPDPEDLIRRGKVAFFNTSKGYGFIRDKDTQESIFVHVNGLEEEIQEGDNVTFETEKGPKGLNAIKVKRV